MYCYNCGKKIDEKAVVCVGCGVAVGKKATYGGKSVASLVLGIIGGLYSSLSFLGFIIIANEGYATFERNFVATIFTYSITITGFCLAVSARKNKRNGLNSAGFILNLISIILATLWLYFV
jgi:hypothetical protein